MLNTRTRAGRAAAVTFALAGALGLSACQDSGPTAAPPTPASPTAESEPTTAPEETTSPEETSEAPETSESPSSSESSSSESSSGDTGDTTLTPEGTNLKFGQSANVRESSSSASSDGYRIQVDALEKAPESAYTGNITKANGTLYYLRYTVTNTGQHQSGAFDASDVNGFMLTPKLASGQKGKKILGSATNCESESTELAVGESGKGCDAYQAPGAEITDVVWSPGLRTVVTWTK